LVEDSRRGGRGEIDTLTLCRFVTTSKGAITGRRPESAPQLGDPESVPKTTQSIYNVATSRTIYIRR